MPKFQKIQTKFLVVREVKLGKIDGPISSRHNNKFKSVIKSIIALLHRSV